MARIVEFLTVNVASRDAKAGAAALARLGLGQLPPSVMPQKPAEITDVTVPIGDAGAISVISPTAPTSVVQRFLDRRGEGLYSIAVRVDDLDGAMREWEGIEWVLDHPYRFPPGTPAARYAPEILRANWIKPGMLAGVLLEVFEFQGAVEPHHPEASTT